MAQVVSWVVVEAEEHSRLALSEAMAEGQEVLNENRWLEVEEEAAPGHELVSEEEHADRGRQEER